MAEVLISTPASVLCRVRCDEVLKAVAMRWNYVVRQRHRWLNDRSAYDRQVCRLQQDLAQLGIDQQVLQNVQGVVQVTLPWSERDRWWESRIMPWEFALAEASKTFRNGLSLLVVRHLRTGRRIPKRVPQQCAWLASVPQSLSAQVDLAAEQALLADSFDPQQITRIGQTTQPTDQQIKQGLKSASPDVIHVSAVDNRSARSVLGMSSHDVRDGFNLCDAAGQPEECRAERIADLLTQGSPKPIFVGFNSFDSGVRLAPMTLKRGVAAAVGMQHTYSSSIAELFFLHFYRAAVESQWNLLIAFTSAMETLSSDRLRLRGSGMNLWSAESLIGGKRFDDYQLWQQRRTQVSKSPSKTGQRRAGLSQLRRADPELDRAADLIQVTVRPKAQLNFSALHNGESLFESLAVRFVADRASEIGAVEDLQVSVKLIVGMQAYPFHTRFALDRKTYRYDLSCGLRKRACNGGPEGGCIGQRAVHLPLPASLFHGISERTQASLFVDLTWHDQVAFRHAYPVWISPADHWSLEDQQISLLPSFVQPRDPKINQIVEVAHKYLRSLADRVSVGFDGYQSYQSSAQEADRWEGVDCQVRAIWSALLLEYQLGYINPPPSYEAFRQRLRTPSQTLGGGFGTCVDLALLLVAAMEWIEIHPVLFLLNGHVFAGYWKDVRAHQDFMDVMTDAVPSPDDTDAMRDDPMHWVSGRKTYSEIRAWVQQGCLVPIETVALTEQKGFGEAVAEGQLHFQPRHSHSFRAMIDLVSAREGDPLLNNAVRPLPFPTQTIAQAPSGYQVDL